mmetsp:Transcript_25484/g.73150  ORF Transcript_25484/g.73150 Transcript_25484/m.73150 type:complete len:230 (+) Transcript_25484:288-977(+)
MLCPGFRNRPYSCCNRFCSRMSTVFRSAACKASSSAASLLAQLAGGEGICRAVIAGASGSGSKASSKPGAWMYQRTRLMVSRRAASSVLHCWPGNLWRTPKRSSSSTAQQDSPSHSAVQRSSVLWHRGLARRHLSRSRYAPVPCSDVSGQSAFAEVPPCCVRSTSPHLPTKKPKARSAASRCASFFEGRQPPAAWWGRPSSTKATTARNSRVVKFSMRVSKPHWRIGRC